MKNITDMTYIQTPFKGHRVLAFSKKGQQVHGKGYYKMNTSILADQKYKEMVTDTINELEDLEIDNAREKWEILLLTIKSKSIEYSKLKNKTNRNLKNAIARQILEMETKQAEPNANIDQIHYDYLNKKLREIEENEVEGYIRRTRYFPDYEKNEPDIAFYAKLEEKHIATNTIGQLAESKDDKIYTDNENMMKIASKFYTNLYTPNKVNTKIQDKLLKNINQTITQEQKDKLDALILEEEVKIAVFQLLTGKSPGMDGIPVEFYQQYWDQIKDYYMEYINYVRTEGFSKTKNTSVIKIV